MQSMSSINFAVSNKQNDQASWESNNKVINAVMDVQTDKLIDWHMPHRSGGNGNNNPPSWRIL